MDVVVLVLLSVFVLVISACKLASKHIVSLAGLERQMLDIQAKSRFDQLRSQPKQSKGDTCCVRSPQICQIFKIVECRDL